MTLPAPPTDDTSATQLVATHGARAGIQVPPARAIVRAFPLDDERHRFLLAVAEGIGDPPSAEAQAAEALGRLEATVSRAATNASREAVLDAGFAAADEAVARLLRLPGSVPGSGAVLVAAVVDDGEVTLGNLGRGGAFLLRSGTVHRLTPDQRPIAGQQPGRAQAPPRGALGAGGPAEPELLPGQRLQAGDTLLLCSEAVARRLGERVIGAVAEEAPAGELAQRLADLATGEAGADGAAVASLHVPGPDDAPALAPMAAGVTEPDTRRWLWPLLVVAAAILLGAAVVLAIFYVASRGTSSPKATSTATSAATAAVPNGTVLPSPAAGAAATPSPSPSPSPAGASPTPSAGLATPVTIASPAPSAGGSPTASAIASAPASPITAVSATPVASPTPLVTANLPACSSSNLPPCLYTASPGDSVSTIGDRFSVTAACFEAANRNHSPVPPQPPAHSIGAGEVYVVPGASNCAALTGAAAASAQPTPACTPRPGAAVPPPGC